MCWCPSNIRTPFCGKPECHPPVEQSQELSLTDLRASVRDLEHNIRVQTQLLETKFGVRVEHVLLRRTEQLELYGVQVSMRL